MQRKEGPQKWRYVLDGLLTKDFLFSFFFPPSLCHLFVQSETLRESIMFIFKELKNDCFKVPVHAYVSPTPPASASPSPLYPTDPHPPLPTYVYDGSFAPCYGVRTTVLGLAL